MLHVLEILDLGSDHGESGDSVIPRSFGDSLFFPCQGGEESCHEDGGNCNTCNGMSGSGKADEHEAEHDVTHGHLETP